MVDETMIKRISSGLTARFEVDGDISADSVEAYLNQQMAGLESQARIAALQAVLTDWETPASHRCQARQTTRC